MVSPRWIGLCSTTSSSTKRFVDHADLRRSGQKSFRRHRGRQARSRVAPNAPVYERGHGPHIPSALEHVPQKWAPVLRKRTCSNKKPERDDDSKKNHPALVSNISGAHNGGPARDLALDE